MIVTDVETYLNYIRKKVQLLIDKKKSSIFLPNEELSPEVVSALKAEFSKDWHVEVNKCKQCTNSYDVIIW